MDKRRKIAIVGAGAAGLISARHLIGRHKDFDVTVFEQSGRIGGVWVFNKDDLEDEKKGLPKTAMYRNLRTNLPKEVMTFLDCPFDNNIITSFPHHSEVLKYLENFAKRFKIQDFIKFYTKVKEIRPCGDTKWEVTTCDVITKSESTSVFDYVMLCNGNFALPVTFNISNLEEFKGEVSHSLHYDDATNLKDKTVVCLGAGNSGLDIAIEALSTAKKVYLSSRAKEQLKSVPPEVIQIPGLESAKSNGFVDTSGSFHEADVLIVCTGYQYSYPFLHPDCGIEIKQGGKLVYPLYRHMVNIRHPTMVFIGIPFAVLPFLIMDIQVRFFVRILDDVVHLRPTDEMLQDLEEEFEESNERYYHKFGDKMWKYMDDLSIIGGLPHYPPVTRLIYEAVHKLRTSDLLTYRGYNFTIKNQSQYAVSYKKS